MIDPDEIEKQEEAEKTAQLQKEIEADDLEDMPALIDEDDVMDSEGLVSFLKSEFYQSTHLRPHNHAPTCRHSKMTQEENAILHRNFKQVEAKGEAMVKAVRIPMSNDARVTLTAFIQEQKGGNQLCDAIRNQFFVFGKKKGHWVLDINISPMDRKYPIPTWHIWSENPNDQKDITKVYYVDDKRPYTKNPTFGLASLLYRYFEGQTKLTEDVLIRKFGPFCPVLAFSETAMWMCECDLDF